MPYQEYDKTLEELKSNHPKARHFVTAFRYLNEYDQVVEGCSDDGEPRGTSGKPTLSVLQGHSLINIALICVRYFGGTKLGTGGLVRAYSDSANLVIENSKLIKYEKEALHVIEFTYSSTSKVEYLLEQNSIAIKEKNFNENGAQYKIQAPQKKLDEFFNEASRLIEKVE